jgi:hypothetical protein
LASRSYEVSDQSLVVRCRGEIVGDIPLETIVAFRIRGRVSGWSFFSSPSTWLRWPSGQVTTTDQGYDRHTTRLPELILWGEAARDAEDAIREALAAHRRSSMR